VIINSSQLPSGKVFGYPSIQTLKAAELFLLEKAQKGLKATKMRLLNVDTALEEDVNGITRKLVVIGSRGRNQIQEVYGQANLPVLAKEHKLSELYAQAAHEISVRQGRTAGGGRQAGCHVGLQGGRAMGWQEGH
jgi:hypothetical protein